ncbi:hypothetical protein ABVT39_013434 [Epinephelus coioides]
MFEGERLQKELNNLNDEYKRKSREKAERKNKFIHTGLVITTAEVVLLLHTQAGNHRSRDNGVIADGSTDVNPVQLKEFDGKPHLIAICSQIVNQHFPAVSGAFMDSPYNGNTSLQTSTSNLNTGYSRPSEAEDDGKVSSDTIWLWIAVLATIGNIVVVAVVCACAF